MPANTEALTGHHFPHHSVVTCTNLQVALDLVSLSTNHGAPGAARTSAALQQATASAELAAVRAVHELEAAAKQAAAAAIRLHESKRP